MPVEFGQQSEYAKEMRKHEAGATQFGPGLRPYQFREFPKRLYRADRVDGKIVIVEAHTVQSPDEERNLLSRGFAFGQDVAMAAIERQQLVYGELAAEREYEIRHGRLSDKATAEVREAESAAGSRHLPEVPRTPKKRGPGRPKTKTELVTEG